MPIVKGGYVARRRRKAVLKLAKGYYGSKHTLYKTAHEQVMRSLQYSYRDRKVRKRDFRKLWIVRINAACRLNDITYSAFINGLKHQDVVLNRKMLAELAVNDAKGFADLVAVAKEGLANPKAKEVEAPKAEPKKVAKKAATPDYESMTLADLKALCKEKGVKGYSTLKKAEIIELLTK